MAVANLIRATGTFLMSHVFKDMLTSEKLVQLTDEYHRLIAQSNLFFLKEDTFFQIKLRSKLKKFNNGKRGFIAFNETALDGNKTFFERKQKEYPNIEFLICEI